MRHARQRTDTIHGTIYFSEFESELSSTPFFYRLHDIYQSSTVYLTFPSNRTKRYEHSLGTMALASEMLCASIANADIRVRDAFIEQLNGEFTRLYRKIFKKEYPNSYLGDNRGIVVDLVKESGYGRIVEERQAKVDSAIDKNISEAISYNFLSDDALNHFSLHSTKNDAGVPAEDQVRYSISVFRERFIYQCILQAIRIAALFHDVGHPPYSHIIENVLDKMYAAYKKKEFTLSADADKAIKLEESLGRFLDNEKHLEFDFLSITKSAVSCQLHEQVGIHMLRMAVEVVMKDTLKSIKQASGDGWTAKNKMIVILYYITAIEFAAAIMLEKNDIFRSIHRIVDGIIDADRLDYVARDSRNSGVDWGSIPYKRLIESAKLVQIDQDGKEDKTRTSSLFVIAYPQKVSSDIEDFLLNRYKIFARINYHHRCTRTAMALQSSVEILARDYLTSPSNPVSSITEVGLTDIDDKLLQEINKNDNDERESSFLVCISPDIHILWTALGSTNGDEALKVLQWNDSWMVSVLQSALLKICTEENFQTKLLLQTVRKAWQDKNQSDEWLHQETEKKEEFLNGVINEKRKELVELRKNLEEFLLNKKAYYALFKRGIDVQHFLEDILQYAELTIPAIKKKLNEEKYKYLEAAQRDDSFPSLWDCLNSPNSSTKNDAAEAIRRLQNFLDAFREGNLQAITSIIIPPEQASVEKIICSVLEQAKAEKEIIDYKLHVNPGWNKTGLSPHDGDVTKEIYLYNQDTVFQSDESKALYPKIKTVQHSMLWLYVYVNPTEHYANSNDLLASLRDRCARTIGQLIRNRYDELFPNHS